MFKIGNDQQPFSIRMQTPVSPAASGSSRPAARPAVDALDSSCSQVQYTGAPSGSSRINSPAASLLPPDLVVRNSAGPQLPFPDSLAAIFAGLLNNHAAHVSQAFENVITNQWTLFLANYRISGQSTQPASHDLCNAFLASALHDYGVIFEKLLQKLPPAEHPQAVAIFKDYATQLICQLFSTSGILARVISDAGNYPQEFQRVHRRKPWGEVYARSATLIAQGSTQRLANRAQWRNQPAVIIPAAFALKYLTSNGNTFELFNSDGQLATRDAARGIDLAGIDEKALAEVGYYKGVRRVRTREELLDFARNSGTEDLNEVLSLSHLGTDLGVIINPASTEKAKLLIKAQEERYRIRGGQRIPVPLFVLDFDTQGRYSSLTPIDSSELDGISQKYQELKTQVTSMMAGNSTPVEAAQLLSALVSSKPLGAVCLRSLLASPMEDHLRPISPSTLGDIIANLVESGQRDTALVVIDCVLASEYFTDRDARNPPHNAGYQQLMRNMVSLLLDSTQKKGEAACEEASGALRLLRNAFKCLVFGDSCHAQYSVIMRHIADMVGNQEVNPIVHKQALLTFLNLPVFGLRSRAEEMHSFIDANKRLAPALVGLLQSPDSFTKSCTFRALKELSSSTDFVASCTHEHHSMVADHLMLAFAQEDDWADNDMVGNAWLMLQKFARVADFRRACTPHYPELIELFLRKLQEPNYFHGENVCIALNESFAEADFVQAWDESRSRALIAAFGKITSSGNRDYWKSRSICGVLTKSHAAPAFKQARKKQAATMKAILAGIVAACGYHPSLKPHVEELRNLLR